MKIDATLGFTQPELDFIQSILDLVDSLNQTDFSFKIRINKVRKKIEIEGIFFLNPSSFLESTTNLSGEASS
ncbi:hypothetical protein [Methanosarcina horonobensis]|uniref:hypothetical protein n=1 Tax=Methanosarcina horonobensis TaxID=418008 RepID=UPI00138E3461|nr:hypothetical protein [Methanosarcina horonobensis]